MHLDRHVRQAADPRKPFLIDPRRLGIVRHDCERYARMAGSETPEVKIRDAIAADLEPLANRAGEVLPWNGVQQRRRGRAEEPPRPSRNDESANNAHEGIKPSPAVESAG